MKRVKVIIEVEYPDFLEGDDGLITGEDIYVEDIQRAANHFGDNLVSVKFEVEE